MREILFRGKTEKGEWIEGFYGCCKIASPSRMFGGEENIFTEKHILFNDLVAGEVIPETVGQFTGLTDKNGNKIFEGDILQEYNGIDRGYIRYCDDDGMYYLVADNVLYDFSTCNSKWYEVIGNIHDNPELLEG